MPNIIQFRLYLTKLLQKQNSSTFYGSQCINQKIRYISPICRQAPSKRICTKFCTGGRLTDIITLLKFFVNRFRGFGSARSPNFAILHWLSRSLLTQVCATARLWLYASRSLVNWRGGGLSLLNMLQVLCENGSCRRKSSARRLWMGKLLWFCIFCAQCVIFRWRENGEAKSSEWNLTRCQYVR